MIETKLIIRFDYKEGRDKFLELMENLAKNIPSIYTWEVKELGEE